MICPICYNELEEQEARSGYNTDETEDVFVCINSECENYGTIVYNMGDLE